MAFLRLIRQGDNQRLENPELPRLTWTEFVIAKPTTTIGRDIAADIPLRALYVSRSELKIVQEGLDFYLEHLASRKNATFVNGVKPADKPGKRHLLADGDSISIGNYEFSFHLSDNGTSTEK